MDYQANLDPEVAALLSESLIGSVDFGSLALEAVPFLREAMVAMCPPQESPGVVHREVVAETAGRNDVNLRLSSPVAPGPARPCVIWMHGGGYLMGAPAVDDGRINRWVEEFDCVAVAVDFRLAPEYRFPAAIEDCYSALLWAASHADQLGIDPDRIVIGGCSAGGGLTAALALMARDRGEVAVRYQFLIYPMMDDRTEQFPSGQLAAPIWPARTNALAWRTYLGREPGDPDVSPYAAAPRATDLAGLPPAFIGIGNLDISRDEAVHYGLRLLEAGVPTEIHVYAGAPHGFDVLTPTAALTQRFQGDLEAALRPVLRSLRYVSIGE